MLLTDQERFNLMTAALTFLTLEATKGSIGRITELERIVKRLQDDQNACAQIAAEP